MTFTHRQPAAIGYRVSVDCGGTFTDGVLFGEGSRVWLAKADSTPRDPTAGTTECIARLARQIDLDLPALLAATRSVVIGTTLATNVVATHTGARTGIITTRGYRDRLAFLHVAKSDLGGDRKAVPAELFSFRSHFPLPLVPRHLTVEVDERLDFRGRILTALDEEDVRHAVQHLHSQGVESVAVNLLHSPANPVHELRIETLIRELMPHAYVALSSRVLPVRGEVSRWSTTAFSAYVAPRITEFVQRISATLAAAGFGGSLAFIQSNGGVATGEVVRENPAALLLSGPAAGPPLGLALGSVRGISNLVTADMGGTSLDISIIAEGQVNVVQKKIIDGRKFGLPTVDVNAVGAGGGSIAAVDGSGRLHVGPASAGAVPGPACYGQGGAEPTVTDANLILGYLNPEYFLGGERALRRDLAEAAIRARVANPLGLSVPEAAAAIYHVVNSNMAGAIAVMFSRRGRDPREFALCAAGGAAPAHIARLTRELGMQHFIVPNVAPVFCAFGMMHADLRHDYTRAYSATTDEADIGRINALFADMEHSGRETLLREGVSPDDIRVARAMDLCYYGQVREQLASVPDGPVTRASLAATVAHFHHKHQRVVGYSEPGYPTVIVRLHLTATARVEPPTMPRIPRATGDVSRALKGPRPAYFEEAGGFTPVAIFDGQRLGPGDVLHGPCIVEERMTTLVLPPGERVSVDAEGCMTTLTRS